MKPIELKRGNQRLVINQVGGGLISYQVEKDGETKDMIVSYESCPEEKVGMMGDVLFPFPGRVKNSEYSFEGKEYKISGTKEIDGNALHGFVTDKEWKVVEKNDDSIKLSYEIKKEEYEKNGYPFSLKIQVKYSLSDNGLKVETEITNTGESKAPFGLGFHPYFTAGTDKADNISLKIDAKKLVEFDDNLFPTGKMVGLDGQELDYNQEKKIGEKTIDNCFTGLVYTNNISKTEISSKLAKLNIWQDKNFNYLQMYSADTIGDKFMRAGFAIEPQTCTGYALNKPEMGLKTIEPGESFKAVWGVDIV